MYLDFYGLKKRPFDMTPDPSFFFPSQKHREALASLIYAVTEKRGFVVITGEIGSGKTTVCRTLLQKLDPAAKAAVVTNTTLTAKQLLEAICDQFGLPSQRQTKVMLLAGLNRFLIDQNRAGSTVVLILDEAQNLSVKALEEIRLISNMETDTQKLIQIMLLGQPELRLKLNRADLEQLRQRISLRYHLRSLDKEETRRYIQHRLSIAGDRGQVKFTKGAVDSLYQFSKGTPRLINVVCDQALLMGYLRETRKIDRTIIREIAEEFNYPSQERDEGEPRPGRSDAEEKPFRFWRFFRRGRSAQAAGAAAPGPLAAENNSQPARERAGPAGAGVSRPEDDGGSPLTEADILRKLSELKIASISAENGDFVAAVDGIQLKAGDHLFGISVVRVKQDGIVFRSGGKRYQLTIERPGNGGGDDLASLQRRRDKQHSNTPAGCLSADPIPRQE